MPFDRLVRAVDQWAGRHGPVNVLAQIGRGRYRPRHVRHQGFLQPIEFRSVMRDARLIVAHAGMGSIITAMEYGKPMLVMPRRGDLAETRNDHQVATARKFLELGVVDVAMDEEEVITKLTHLADHLDSRVPFGRDRRLGSPTDNTAFQPSRAKEEGLDLVKAVRAFIHGVEISELQKARPLIHPSNGGSHGVLKQAV
jgi:UDP-N-acetylglucosamine transferase subunit ALG13